MDNQSLRISGLEEVLLHSMYCSILIQRYNESKIDINEASGWTNGGST